MGKPYLKQDLLQFIDGTKKELSNLSDIEQFIHLRQVTELTGTLHEAQVVQLKYWFVALTHYTKYTIEIDTEKAKVTYKVTEKKGAKRKNYTQNIKKLKKYIKFLLGPKYTTEIMDLCQKSKAR